MVQKYVKGSHEICNNIALNVKNIHVGFGERCPGPPGRGIDPSVKSVSRADLRPCFRVCRINRPQDSQGVKGFRPVNR